MHPALDIARVPRRPPPLDYAIALVLGVWALAEALLADGPGTPLTRALVACGYVLPVLMRRRFPLLALAIIIAVLLPWAITADTPEQGAMPFPCMLVVVFSCGLHVRQIAVGLAAIPMTAAALTIIVQTDYWSGTAPSASEVVILTFFLSGAFGFGRLLRRRAAQLAAAQAESGELAREAVVAERARIARELHDVVAHSVSIIAMQAGAASELVERDPAQAREHMETVRLTAQDAMREMRRLVEVLREDDATYAPQPTLASVGDLVEDARVAGVPVEFEEVGERRELPPGVDLAAYRVVQEALTNVRKHAGGAATRLRLRYEPSTLDILVVNEAGAAPSMNGSGVGGGFGLVGMRERVRLYGGTVEAAPVPDGGFLVHVSLPLPEESR